MSKINWLFLECSCHYDIAKDKNKKRPDMCNLKNGPCYQCAFNGCPYFTFTSAENAIAYIGNDSSSKKEILLGDEDNLELWEHICSKKIDEAYDEYLQTNK